MAVAARPVGLVTVHPLAARLRWIAVRGTASLLAGIVVLGVGGRGVMLVSRLLHPEAIGRLTENGNRIGEVTLGGTFGLILFGGLFGGLVAGVVWAVVREWVPDRGVWVGLGATALGGFLLVEADNRDFTILVDPAPDVALLLALPFLFGVALHRLDHRLDRSLPAASGPLAIAVYAVIAALGAPFVVLTFGLFLSGDFCSCEAPVWAGAALVLTAAATVTWWGLALRGVETPPRWLRRVGTAAAGAAVVAGGLHLAGQVLEIL